MKKIFTLLALTIPQSQMICAESTTITNTTSSTVQVTQPAQPFGSRIYMGLEGGATLFRHAMKGFSDATKMLPVTQAAVAVYDTLPVNYFNPASIQSAYTSLFPVGFIKIGYDAQSKHSMGMGIFGRAGYTRMRHFLPYKTSVSSGDVTYEPETGVGVTSKGIYEVGARVTFQHGTPSGGVMPYFFGGIGMQSYEIDASRRPADVTQDKIDSNNSINTKDSLKKTQWIKSLACGFGVEFLYARNLMVNMEMRFSFGEKIKVSFANKVNWRTSTQGLDQANPTQSYPDKTLAFTIRPQSLAFIIGLKYCIPLRTQ